MLIEAGDRATRPLRDIAGGSSAASRALAETRDRLKALERAQADVGSFRQLKAGLRSTQQEMQTARQRAADLGRQMAETQNPSRALTREFDRTQRQLAQLERSERQQSQELQEMTLRLHAAGVDTANLSRHERELRTDMMRTNREMTEQERRLTRIADRERRMANARARFSRVQGMATGMAASGGAAIGTGIAMAAPIIGAVRAAQEYESVMTDIGQKADLSRAASAGLGKGLLVAARAANKMPADLQAGVDALAGLGATVPNAVAMMTPIGRAATAYKAEIADLSNAAFAATDNLKVPVEQTERVIDIMAQAGKSGAFEIKDMAQYFPALTAAYQGLGQTGTGAVADLAAGLQIARKGAGDAATAATNIGNVLQKVTSPATNRAFKKMGVDLPKALQQAYKEGKTPLEAIAELTNRTLKGDLSKLGYLFEDAQVQQGLRPLIQNIEEYRRIRADAAGADGVTDRDFAERMKDSAEQINALKVNATTLAITMGAQLLPTVNAVVEKATVFAQWLGDVANRYPNVTKAVAVGAAGFAALFFVLGGGAILIAGLIAPFAALSFAAGALGIGLLPVIGIAAGVVAGVIAIGAAAYAIYSNWDGISAWFGRQWDSLKDVANSAIAWFANLQVVFSEIGRNILTGLINGIISKVPGLRGVMTAIAGMLPGTAKRKLDIHSPSRVFAGIGGHIVDGLTNGIAAQEAEPVRRMDSLSRRLSAAIVTGSAIPSMAMAAPGAPGGRGTPAPMMAPAPITINVHGAPGQSEQALAEAVAREVAKVMGQQRATSFASFADTPDWENG